jgi:hypothetical protein
MRPQVRGRPPVGGRGRVGAGGIGYAREAHLYAGLAAKRTTQAWSAAARERRSLHQAALLEAHVPAILAEDDMIQDLDPEKRPRGHEAPRQGDVLGGWLGVALYGWL